MKKIIYSISLVLVIVFGGCTEDDLNVTMYGSREDKEFYKNLDDFKQMVTTGYFMIKLRYGDEMMHQMLLINDCPTDDCEKGGGSLGDYGDVANLESFNIYTTNGFVAQMWKTCYQGIYQVNLLLDNAAIYRQANSGLSDADAKMLTRYENEAKWLRGYFYFHLAYFFGDVPLFIHAENPNDIYKERSPVSQVWDQVVSDFTAATNLPKRSEYAAEDMGRATSGAAWAMLGRTYWFRRDFAKAKTTLDVLTVGAQKNEYSLDADFASQWLTRNSNVKESIFEIQYKTNGKAWNFCYGWCGITFIPACDGGYEFHWPNKLLMNDFDPEDPRITWTFVMQGDKFKNNNHAINRVSATYRMYDRKHFYSMSESSGATPPIAPQDLVATNYVIRYADVLLMYAECLLEAGDIAGAKTYLNKIRKRARESSPLDNTRETQIIKPATKPSSLPDITSADPEVVRQAIWTERRHELACEGLRRMDLIQQQRYGTVMTAYFNNTTLTKENPAKGQYWTKEKELYPIPQSERDLSHGKLTQNPGY